MNERELFDVLGEVDEGYIEDASPEKKPKPFPFSAVACLAACLALVLALFPVLFILSRKPPKKPPLDPSEVDVVVWGTGNEPVVTENYNCLNVDTNIVNGMNNYQFDADQTVNVVYAMAANCSPENTAVLDSVKQSGMKNSFLPEANGEGVLVLFLSAEELGSLDPEVYGDLVFYNISKEEYDSKNAVDKKKGESE